MNDFVDIPNCYGYKANRLGEIQSNSGKILKPQTNTNGYYKVSLYQNGNKKQMLVHRLVALAFIPNPQGLPQIDHINNIKTDNRIENIRWITSSDNLRRQERIVNGKCYCWHKTCWQTRYTIEGKQHSKYFKHEDDAAFYVSLLKAIYPRF